MTHIIYGIRHHGPGSAKSLIKALKTQQPDCILIEGPTDANKMITHVAKDELKPPIALLLYNPKELTQASYFPFAKFSPEWQAMKYGLQAGVTVAFMDLPMEMSFGLDLAEKSEKQPELFRLEVEPKEKPTDADDIALAKDPLGYMARLAGFEDSERWWEVMFEAQDEQAEIFPAIVDLMGTLRKEIKRPETKRTLQREAYMRKTIRKAIKDGFKNIAVVCGAWHSPVLADLKPFKVSADNAILKGIKKVKTEHAWVPWTYERLSFSSGYGAGVLSPAWYELLFSTKKDIVTRWMIKVAKLLRKEDLDASSAHVIEAVRLADTLAALRQLPIAGIQEMREAAVTIFGGGYEEVIQLIDEKLIIGDKIGQIPDDVPKSSIQKDFESYGCMRRKANAVHKAYYNGEIIEKKEFNLREPAQREVSLLMHRLNILNIPFGIEKSANKKGTSGSFSEMWQIHWKVDYALKVIEAGIWGNTVYSAAVNFAAHQARENDDLALLLSLMRMGRKAGLVELMPVVSKRIFEVSAVTKDLGKLMEAIPELVLNIRLSNTDLYKSSDDEKQLLFTILHNIIPRILISLPSACVGLDEKATKDMFDRMQSMNKALQNLNEANYLEAWNKVLYQIAEEERVNGIIAGGCSRLLFDKSVISEDIAAGHMSYFLSMGNTALSAAQWVEGFLFGSGLLLIINPKMWNILDSWVNQLEMEQFQDVLPLLRRTFSEFTVPERQKMMEMAIKGQVSIRSTDSDYDLNKERAEQVLPMVRMLLGMGE